MRRIVIALAALALATTSLAPSIVAGPLEEEADPGAVPGVEDPPHPPIHVQGDQDLEDGGLNGVRGGSGTADDPYVIANWTFLVQSSPNYLVGVTTTDGAGIVLEDTDAHVVIRSNTFQGTLPERAADARVAVESAPGVVLHNASNVRVVGNAFHDVGGTGLGAVGLRASSEHVTVASNTFEDGDRPTIALHGASQARIVGNDIQASSHDCCISYDVILLENVRGGTEVRDNTVHAVLGAGLGAGHTAIGLEGNVGGNATVRIEGNTVTGEHNAISVWGSLGSYEAGRVVVRNNTVDASGVEGTCLFHHGHDGVVAGNQLDGCGGFSVSDRVLVGRNLYRGGVTLDLTGLHDTVVDPEPDLVTWLRTGALQNVTLRDMDVRTGGSPARFLDVVNLTIEDASFRGGNDFGRRGALHVDGSGTLTLSNVTAHGKRMTAIKLMGPMDLVAEDVHTVGAEKGLDAQLHEDSTVRVEGGLFEDAEDALLLHGFANATVANATFQGNDVGLRVNEPGGPVTVRNASFVGNAGFGLTTEQTLPVDARWSWWGNASGPEDDGNPDGTGDAVLGPVDYDPWLASPP